VAIARAAANRPRIIFVDEPTASLDQENAQKAVTLLEEISEQACVIVVTHDPTVLRHASQTITMHNGRIVSGTQQ